MTDVPTPFDVHELLTAPDFVRRLARSLVFDQARVDDVVQEAWAAAVQRPPQQRAAAAGWFRSVLHNLARRHARDEARRRARELLAARPEALPSAADVLAREQQRREVVDAVMALAEPYRGTVLARFFDDLEPAEIARRRGVPAATVRSQLHRALEQLRQQLDQRHGSRQAWGLWLLPLARPARAVGSGVAAAGALLMAKVLCCAGALALAVLGVLWLGGGSTPAPVAGAPQVALAGEPAASSAGPIAAPVERAQLPARAPASAAATSPGAAGLRGRVVHADGRLAADALVRVLGIDGVALFVDAPASGDQRTLPLPRGEARTGRDGVFAIAGLAPSTRYAVHADADGPDRTMRLASLTPFPGETADLGDIVLSPKGGIAGRAVDSRGEPVAGAEVLALDLPAALLAALPFDRFRPEHGGMLSLPVPDGTGAVDPAAWREHLRGYLGRDLFERADLDRQPGLAAMVVDRLPWLETLWRELPIARTTTAADGTFTLRGVEPGGNLLLVRKAGLDTGSKPRVLVQAGEPKPIGDVRLPDGEVLRGVVRSADGEPVANAEVRVAAAGALGYRGIAFAEAPVRTAADGSFSVPGLGRGRWLCAARAGACDAWQVEGPLPVDADVELRLPARSELRVRLLAADGSALVGPRLELFAGPHLHELRRAGLQQKLPLPAGREPDAAGDLSLGAWPDGCYTLHVEADGAMPAELMLMLPQPEPAALTLRAAARATVRVRDADGAPIAGARVYVADRDPSAEAVLPADYGLPRWRQLPLFAGTSDAAGELLVQYPVDGGSVHVTHPLYAPATVDVASGATGVDVALPRPGVIQGRLFDHGVPADPRRYAIVAEVTTIEPVPLPDLRAGLQADGSFAFRNAAPTQYDVRAEPIGTAPLSLQRFADELRELVTPHFFGESPVSQHVSVTAGATATVEFDVDPQQPKPGEVPARLTGRVLVDGVPLVGAEVQRTYDFWRKATLATVLADGTFAIAALPPGEQQLVVAKDGVDVWRGELALPQGGARVLDLDFRTGSLAGTAAFASGLPLLRHTVTALGESHGGTVSRAVPIDAAGRFTFPALPAGAYTVFANGPDGHSEPERVEIAAGAAAAPLHLQMVETPCIGGRVLGDFGGRSAMIVLHKGDSWHGVGLAPDGSFHFGDLEEQSYRLELRVGSRTLALEPGTFDLRLGSQRDLQLRAVEPAK